MEFREVTREERERMMQGGVFDINGNIPAHPGYAGIHKVDESYYFRGNLVTDPIAIHAIEYRNDKKNWFARLFKRN